MSVVRRQSDRVSEPGEPVAPPISAKRLLLILGGAFERRAGGVHGLGASNRGSEPDGISSSALAANHHRLPRSTYPRGPEVVATVIYEGAGAKACAIVTTTPAPGLPTGDAIRTAERSASLPVRGTPCSLDDRVTNAVSRAVCAVPR
jgi:hypothetical protein